MTKAFPSIEAKLNVGSGTEPSRLLPSPWINVDIASSDPARRFDVRALPLEWTRSFIEVRASHVLEHLYLEDWASTLGVWGSMLVSGGRLRLVMPDLDIVVADLARGLDSKNRPSVAISRTTAVLAQIYGIGYNSCRTEERWRHRMIANFDMIEELLRVCGFVAIARYDKRDDPAACYGINDDSQNRFSMHITANKE